MTKQPPKKTVAMAVHKPAGTGAISLVNEGVKLIRSGLEKLAEATGGESLAKVPTAVVAGVYDFINKDWLKVLTDHKKALNAHLMELLIKTGHPSEKDPAHVTELTVEHKGASYLLQRKAYKSKLPNPGKLKALAPSLTYEKFCNAEITYVPDAVKLKQCMDEGLVTEEQIEAAKDDMPVSLWVTKE